MPEVKNGLVQSQYCKVRGKKTVCLRIQQECKSEDETVWRKISNRLRYTQTRQAATFFSYVCEVCSWPQAETWGIVRAYLAQAGVVGIKQCSKALRTLVLSRFLTPLSMESFFFPSANGLQTGLSKLPRYGWVGRSTELYLTKAGLQWVGEAFAMFCSLHSTIEIC